MTTMSTDSKTRLLASIHALYFLIGGGWAVTGKRTFEAVTGPKADYWLVRTVGGLLSVGGVVIAGAAIRDRLTTEIRWLALGMSGVLATVSLIYSLQGRIRSIYLLDTVANLLLIGGWLSRRRWATSSQPTTTASHASGRASVDPPSAR